jgi:hypothetical protein
MALSIIEIYNRLNRELGDPTAFPRPNDAVMAAFQVVGLKGKPADPITTIEIEALTGVSYNRLSTALATLAGLLALYGGDYKLHRVNLNPGNLPRYGYFIRPTKRRSPSVGPRPDDSFPSSSQNSTTHTHV